MIMQNDLSDNALWYKDGIIYQVHVKAYKDSNNDGIGDFGGLREKLDYIKNLGVNIIWLLPFYPSPLKDDGYDIADYFNIHPDYGTLDDVRAFLKEAHQRNIRVITEMVLNHTSDQHPWFQESRRSNGDSAKRKLYVWNDTPDKYNEARIIFSDFESSNWAWDPVAKSYYWHRFYSHQPDLNFENPLVHRMIYRAVDFWFNLGVDGLRLDAVPYLFEREGTNCENLPETHAFLKQLSSHVQNKFKNKMLLAEANQWPEDAVAYFGEGDECHMAFHFPLMPRIFMAIQMEDRFPIIDILEQTPTIPTNCQWAMFLRNHDELTLEMVTDEERDYMYRFYAKESKARINLGIRRRLAPLVENNRRKIELLNILLFSFPGTPIIYYGDEIGMGDNFYLGDRNGVRTPMQWSSDRNAGFSITNPQRLFLPIIIDPEYHYEAINVEVQQRNPSSLLWWMKRAIAIRKNYKAFGRGTFEFLSPNNPKVIAFIRKYENESILVVANLSRFSQVVELDLSSFGGYIPMEVFSRNKFPEIKNSFYMLTLNAYDYYWFSLIKKEQRINIHDEKRIPELVVKNPPLRLKAILEGEEKENFTKDIIGNYLKYCGWFNPGEEKIQDISLTDQIPLKGTTSNDWLFIIRINYIDKLPETYQLFVTVAEGEKAKRVFQHNSSAVIARIKKNGEESILIDGLYDEEFRYNILRAMVRKRIFHTEIGEFAVTITNRSKKYIYDENLLTPTRLVEAENNRLDIFYDSSLLIRIYRMLEEGISPGVEVLKTLSEKTNFYNINPFAGAVFYRTNHSSPLTIGVFKEYVFNENNSWIYFSDAAKRFFEIIVSKPPDELKDVKLPAVMFMEGDELDKSELLNITIDRMNYEMINILGQRTAEMHIALNSIKDDPAFLPETFSMFYQRSIYQSIRSLIRNTYQNLRKNMNILPERLIDDAKEVLANENLYLDYLGRILKSKINAGKIRIHGYYHLKQVLYTGKDFVITNFEGNPNAAMSERKLKRSPLRDVAAMIWSLFSSSNLALKQFQKSFTEEAASLETFSILWWLYMSSNFFGAYYNTIKASEHLLVNTEYAGLLPKEIEENKYLLQLFFLERMFQELNYGLTTDTGWLEIPIKASKYISANLMEDNSGVK